MVQGGSRKYINALKTLYSWEASNISGRAKINGMPVSLGIELTNCCNLNCPECASGSGLMTRPKGYMSPDLFNKIIDEAGKYILYINLYFQGEPMLHPSFFEFARRIKGIESTVSTNGHFLNAENAKQVAVSGISTIIVSLDGMDQDTYSRYRVGGDLEKVLNGIRALSMAIKETCARQKLEIQFLVNRYNENQIAKARGFASEVNAVFRLKSMQVLNTDKAGEWLPANEKSGRYRLAGGKYELKRKLRNRCLRLWMNPVITWDGKVVPCCFDKDADHVLGDMNKESLREIWYGEKARKFRQSLLDDRSKIEICSNCTTGLSGVKY